MVYVFGGSFELHLISKFLSKKLPKKSTQKSTWSACSQSYQTYKFLVQITTHPPTHKTWYQGAPHAPQGGSNIKKTNFSIEIYELQNTKFLRDYSNTVCFGSASVANGKLYQNLTFQRTLLNKKTQHPHTQDAIRHDGMGLREPRQINPVSMIL